MNNNTLKDALYVVSGDSGASDGYRRGMMRGIMRGIEAWNKDMTRRSSSRTAASHVLDACHKSDSTHGVLRAYQTEAMRVANVPDAPPQDNIPPDGQHDLEQGLIVGMVTGWMYGTGHTFERAIREVARTGEWLFHFPYAIDHIPTPLGWDDIRDAAPSLPPPQEGDAPNRLKVLGVFTQGLQGWYVYGECTLCDSAYIGTPVLDIGCADALPLGKYICNGEVITHCKCEGVTE